MSKLHPGLQLLIGSVLLILVGPLSLNLPGYPPITLQSLIVILIPALIGYKGLISIALYLIAGAAGLPVFANFSGGLEAFSGNTAGFLFGFLLVGVFAATLSKFLKNTYVWQFLLFLICHVALLIIGLGYQLTLDFSWSEVWGNAQRLFPGMFVKSFAGAILAVAIKK